jgi:hypothetical protein
VEEGGGLKTDGKGCGGRWFSPCAEITLPHWKKYPLLQRLFEHGLIVAEPG